MEGHSDKVVAGQKAEDIPGLPVQQYDQEQPLPPSYSYPAYPGRDAPSTGNEAAFVRCVTSQPGPRVPAPEVAGQPLTSPPNDYLCLSFFSCLCCCLIVGIAAIVQSREYPANTIRSPNVALMLTQRRRRWANNKPTLVHGSYITVSINSNNFVTLTIYPPPPVARIHPWDINTIPN